MARFLLESSHLSPQQIMTEAEVEQIVWVTAAVEPLGSQLQHSSIMLYSVDPPTHPVSSLQYFRPAVSFLI